MREFVRSIFRRFTAQQNTVQEINRRREELASASDDALRETGQRSKDLIETFAVTAIIAARVLGLTMFDVQLQGALALAEGQDRRDADRRRQNAGRGSGRRLVREARQAAST